MKRTIETTLRAGGNSKRPTPAGVTIEVTIDTSIHRRPDSGRGAESKAEETHKKLEEVVSEVMGKHE